MSTFKIGSNVLILWQSIHDSSMSIVPIQVNLFAIALKLQHKMSPPMFQSAIFAHKLSEQFNDDIDKISSTKMS